MYKLYLTLLVIVCCVTFSFAQTCPTGNLTLSSQTDIDNFAANYPDCTELDFDLTINSFGADVTNLNGLSQLESIQGNLSFTLNPALANLSGLENLTNIGGNCSFFQNHYLTSTAALENLTSIGGYLQVFDNDSIVNLEGFNNLTTLGSHLLINGNLSLETITGLSDLTSAGSYLSINDNPALFDLTGLSGLTSVNGFLRINNNDSLEDLESLANLESINGYMDVKQNAKLISLKGLEQIDPITISDLDITDNARLMVCEVASICSYLESGGTRIIGTNGCGCNLEADVVSFCDDVCTNSGYTFTSQAEIDNFIIDNPTCRRIYGDVIIEETIASDISNFDGLANVGSIIGNLHIKNNTSPVNLTGLDNLLAVADDLVLDGNDALTTLDGFELLKLTYGSILIKDNPLLNSLTALNNLEEMDGTLTIDNNDVLTTLDGIQHIDPTGIADLIIQNNPTLSTCAIESVCGYLALNETATISTNAIDCNSTSSVETACIALPVELISFTARKVEASIELWWQTATEENNAGFEIQKSINGSDWEIIGWMDGRGTTSVLQNYQFTDRSPYVGDNYYRLKQIDFDGQFEFSNIVSIKGEMLDIAIQVFPNPSSGALAISVANPNNSKMLATLFNSRGEIVWRSQLIEETSLWRKDFNLKDVGMYFISVQIGKEVYAEKLLVVDED